MPDMDTANAAFAFYRIFKGTVGWGDICMVVEDDPQLKGAERICINCRFNSSRGSLGVDVYLALEQLIRMTDEGIMYRARAEGERIKLQLQDPDVGLVSTSKAGCRSSASRFPAASASH